MLPDESLRINLGINNNNNNNYYNNRISIIIIKIIIVIFKIKNKLKQLVIK